MKLDNKVKDNYKIFTCFDTEQVKQYVDSKGYFTNDMGDFKYLNDCYYGTLNVVDNNSSRPYLNKDFSRYFNFFLPEEFVKQKEKKYRPYTIAEFQNIFKPGYPVRFRPKDRSESEEMLLIFNGYKTIQGAVFVYFGHFAYTLNQLFEDYEWQEHYTDDYKPFGVEE